VSCSAPTLRWACSSRYHRPGNRRTRD